MKTVIVENILPVLKRGGNLDLNHPFFSAAKSIREGQLVAIPTETVYGLGANALDSSAIKKIFEVKGRPSDNPLIVHVSCLEEMKPLVKTFTSNAKILADTFMPGPITLVMKKSSVIPDEVTAGLDTVAIRIPSHEVAKYFIEAAKVPIAAPSANISGRPSPTSLKHVINDLDGKIGYIIDGGYCDIGVESTVVDVTGEVPVILRPGVITAQDIFEVCGCVKTSGKDNKVIRSPGMKYKHYSPKADVFMPESKSINEYIKFIGKYIIECKSENKKIAVYSSEELMEILKKDYPEIKYISFGKRDDVKSALSLLFYALRKADDVGADVIIVEPLSGSELTETYMNRLKKACGEK